MAMMSKTTAAYIAGLLDGEGCFSIHVHKNGRLRGCLMVGNADKEIIQWLRDSFGGAFAEINPSQPNRKKSYQWTLWKHSTIKEFLLRIIPYLRVKKRQAEILYQFFKTFDERNYINLGYRGGLRIQKETLKYRIQLLEEMRKLNQRGLQPKRLNKPDPNWGM